MQHPQSVHPKSRALLNLLRAVLAERKHAPPVTLAQLEARSTAAERRFISATNTK